MSDARKTTRSTRVDAAKMKRVRRYLGARTDSEAIARAIDMIDERRLFHEYIVEHGGTLRSSDWHPDSE